MSSNTTRDRSSVGITNRQGIMLMESCIMGCGSLGLPSSAENSGYAINGLILATVAGMSAFTLYQLVHCATIIKKKERKESVSYFDVCQRAAPILGYAADLSIGAQGYGCCLVYFIILKGWIAELLNMTGLSPAYDALLGLAVMAPLVFMAAQKDLKKLSFASLLSTLSVSYLSLLIVACTVLAWVYPVPQVLPPNISERIPPKAIGDDWGSAASAFIFALGCQQSMVKVFCMLKRPTIKNGTIVAVSCVALASVIYFCVAVGGYLAVGGRAPGEKGNILDTLGDKTKPFRYTITQHLGESFFYLITMAKVGMVLVLSAGFPIQMHPARDSVVTFLNLGMKRAVDHHRRTVEIAITLVAASSIYGIALLKPNYSTVMNLIGATASCYVMYLLPSISYLAAPSKNKAFALISMGIVLFSAGLSISQLYGVVRGVSIASDLKRLFGGAEK